MLEPSSGTYEGGVRTNINDVFSFEGSYGSVCTSSEGKKWKRYTGQDDCLLGISSDRRLEASQGGNSNGGSTGSSSGAVRKMQHEDRGGSQWKVRHTTRHSQ